MGFVVCAETAWALDPVADVDARHGETVALAQALWNEAELGYLEKKSTRLLQDVSWVVPTGGLRSATWVPGTSAHSWQAVAAGGMSIGFKGMGLAARTLATAAIALLERTATVREARAEHVRRRGRGYRYRPLLGDRKPPLDYRLPTQ